MGARIWSGKLELHQNLPAHGICSADTWNVKSRIHKSWDICLNVEDNSGLALIQRAEKLSFAVDIWIHIDLPCDLGIRSGVSDRHFKPVP